MAQEYAKSFYNSVRWKKVQQLYMKSHYHICERCGNPATIVHHKESITPENINDPNITLNLDNLQALCIECHNVVHGIYQVTAAGYYFDENGDLHYTPRI